MRKKADRQLPLNFGSPMKLVREHYQMYSAISEILDKNPAMVDWVHKDLCEEEKKLQRNIEGVSSETILRMVVVQKIEGWSFRETIIRIADSQMLRVFCRVYDEGLIDFTTYNKLVNMIQPSTWEKINEILVRYGREKKGIKGEQLRIDTTVVETDTHFPMDYTLLYDSVRKLSALISRVRDIDGRLVGERRAQVNRARRIARDLGYQRRSKKEHKARVRKSYVELIELTERTVDWAVEVAEEIARQRRARGQQLEQELKWLEQDLRMFVERSRKCVDQARRRVLEGEAVPNDDKIFSIFEPHTELIIRGKAGKEMEFGHMVEIRQVEKGLITGYKTHPKRPAEAELVLPAVKAHEKTFGKLPKVCAADKGFYSEQTVEKVETLGVKMVSIPKKGSRDEKETEWEHSFLFKLAQRFRAGIEAAVSYLKRVFGWTRCLQEGFSRFESWVGLGVLAHNLVLLAKL